ncbi:MAG: DUF2917 domain-containing protein [Deferrisomatales bacterium]
MFDRKRLRTALGVRQTLALDGLQGLSVRCHRGVVWMTPGDGLDHVLSAGMRRRVATPGRVVFEGMADAELELRWRR